MDDEVFHEWEDEVGPFRVQTLRTQILWGDDGEVGEEGRRSSVQLRLVSSFKESACSA